MTTTAANKAGSDRIIVLIGLMGAGKSCVGRRLAQRLGLPFRDADQEVEAAAGARIEDIFAQHGEAEFRAGERKIMARLLAGPPCVLATGGGAFMDPHTRRAIRAHGVSVWLRAELEVLMRRVAKRQNRPLLKQGDPRATMARLIAERHPVYAEADITVDSDDRPPDDTVETVLAALVRHGSVPEKAAAGG